MKHRCVVFLVFFWFHFQVLARDGFIKRRGVHFIKDGSYYYANGFNAYWLMFVASNPAQRDIVTSAFQEAASHGLKVARAWAFSDGGYQPLQFSPGIYNEQMFQGLDFVIYEARRYGIKLMLSLVNNWKDFGGKSQYVQWARDQGQNITSDDDFFTNDVVKGFYKNHVQAILTRLNSITGVAYKDDNTIMAWELINEPRCNSDPSGSTLQAWITEMASYVKWVDRKHLLEIGLEGFYGESATQEKKFNLNIKAGTDFIINNKIRAIDFATIHSYPDQWLPGANDTSQRSFSDKWISTHIHDAQKIIRKPLLLTEFGWNISGFGTKTRDKLFNSVYSKIYSSARRGGAASGSMFWQLLAQGLDSFRDNYGIVLSEMPSTAHVIAKQSRKLTRLRDI